MKRLIWLGCWSYLLIGLAHVVVGSLMPNLLEQYGKDYSAGGSLIFAQFAGFLVGVLVSPLLLAKFGKIYGLLIAWGCFALRRFAIRCCRLGNGCTPSGPWRGLDSG